MKLRRLLFLTLIFLSSASAGLAQSKKPPTVITSDGPLNADFEKKTAVFKDNVVVKDDQGTIHADKMNVYFSKDSNAVEKLECYGNVKIFQEGRNSESDEAVYYALEKKIILTGNPVIRQGSDQYRADVITIFSQDNRVVFEPSAQLIIFPDDDSDSKLNFLNPGE